MGTITDKLSYLNETKIQFKEKLNKLGADILDNATFRSYLVYLDNLYNGLFNLTDMSKNGIIGRTSQDEEPTPSAPQEIKDLSGDIIYSVSGKNLFNEIYPDIVNETTKYFSLYVGEGTFTMSSNTLLPSDNPYASLFFIAGQTTSGASTSENGVYLNRPITIASINGYVTIGYRIYGGINPEDYQTQVEYGTIATNYEEYKGASYPISLGVENYLPNNATTQTINGITYTINEDKSIKINGTARGRADIYLYGSNTDTGSYTYIPKGTYTIDTSNLLDGKMFLKFIEKTAGVVYQTKQNNGLLTLLSQQDCYFYGIMLAVESGKTINNLTFYPQIEKGTKLNSYTPYGTTPIELCKIGTYQDRIYSKDNKFYLHKQIGKFTYNNEGSVSTPKTNYYNISGLGNQGWINTSGTSAYLSNEYPSSNVQNTDANFPRWRSLY